ncbi:unnamed protein product [Effrenium voratum]|nr:unnamed protein product [Effrenium voratum]
MWCRMAEKVLTVDLRHPGRETLELAAERPVALGEASRTIKLEDPQRWGDPVKHYCAVATVRIAGQVQELNAADTPGVAVVLQACTSNVELDRLRREDTPRQRGKHSAYGIGLDLVTPIDEMAWAGVGPSESIANYKVPGGAHDERPFEDVMLMGLGFLVGKKLAVDTVRDELTVTA